MATAMQSGADLGSGFRKMYVNGKWIDAGKWEVDIAGKKYPAIASMKPLFDPANEKIKC